MLFPGGLNENDGTLMEECQEGWNFELRYGDTDLRPRPPNDLKAVAPPGTAANLLTYSEEFDNAAWVKGSSTISANAINGPDGTLTADKLVETAVTNNHYVIDEISATAGQIITASVYAKAGERGWTRIQFNEATPYFPAVHYDLNTGNISSITSDGGTPTATITDAGDGWYRCTMSYTVTTTGTLSISYWTLLNDSTISYLGDITKGLYIRGAQAVIGEDPGQYFKATTPAHGGTVYDASVNGILQLVKRDATETTLIFSDDTNTPTLFEWDGSYDYPGSVDNFTSVRTDNLATGSKLRDVYYSLDDTISIVDVAKLTPLLKWDGTSVTRHLTDLAAAQPVAVTSITRSGSTATVTTTAVHSRATGDLVFIAGADQTDYNIEAEITVTGASTFTYEVANAPATPATGTITWDLGVELYAKYGVIHNNRLWLFNITTDDGTATDLPHMMVASYFEDIDSFDTAKRAQDDTFSTGDEAFFMLSKDLKPINGVTVFNKNLIISTEDGRIYRLVGTDSTNYEWVNYYAGSAAIGDESMINYGNDVAFVRKGGNIETLIATDTSGDVQADDISRWIPDTVKDLTGALTVYDQTNQKVYFFANGKVLVLFKDALYGYGGQFSPWSIYKTQLTSEYYTNAARYMRRPGETTYSVYWGDDTGNIYDMNGGGFGDAATTEIETRRRTKLITDMDPVQEIMNGRVQYRRQGECQLTLEFEWSDDYTTSNSTIGLKGPPEGDAAAYWGGEIYWGGEWYFGQGFSFANKVSTKGFSPTGRSESFFLTAYLNTQVRYKVDNIELYG